MVGGIGRRVKSGRDVFEGIEVDAVGADLRHQLGERRGGGCGRLVGAGVPGEGGEEDAHAAGVELVDHVAYTGNSAGQVANEVELVAVVYSKIGVERPDEDGVDGAEASFDVGEKAVDRVLIFVRIEEGAVPDQHLDLRIDVLGPGKLGPLVFRALVT